MGRIPLFRQGGQPITYADLDDAMGRVNEELPNSAAMTIGAVAYTDMPMPMLGVGSGAAVTLADGTHKTLTLGTTNTLTGNTVVGALADIGTATVGRRTAIVNKSGGVAEVSVYDEANTTINGVKKKLTFAAGGWVLLEETANDKFVILGGAQVTFSALES